MVELIKCLYSCLAMVHTCFGSGYIHMEYKDIYSFVEDVAMQLDNQKNIHYCASLLLYE